MYVADAQIHALPGPRTRSLDLPFTGSWDYFLQHDIDLNRSRFNKGIALPLLRSSRNIVKEWAEPLVSNTVLSGGSKGQILQLFSTEETVCYLLLLHKSWDVFIRYRKPFWANIKTINLPFLRKHRSFVFLHPIYAKTQPSLKTEYSRVPGSCPYVENNLSKHIRRVEAGECQRCDPGRVSFHSTDSPLSRAPSTPTVTMSLRNIP